MIGLKLGNRYEVLREIGHGGMGVVYLANDPLLERQVAVKVVRSGQVSPEGLERFRREAKLVARIDHPAIVTVFDSGEHQDALFFVMPYVDGATLRVLLHNSAINLGDLADISIQIADALDYSHSRGIVHRDIKPENIMVTRLGEGLCRVRITDFGLAVSTMQQRLTRSSGIVGTVSYMSPEQVSGSEVGPASDVYSLGSVLYEAVTGQPPFSGEMHAILYRIYHEIPAPPSSASDDVDEELDELILNCLEKDPARRPTAREMINLLSAYREKVLLSGRGRYQLAGNRSTVSLILPRPSTARLVGREKEFAELQQRLNAALSGECQLVLVAGEAGTGKSRLLQELETMARSRNIQVLYGHMSEVDRALPYNGFCEAIHEYFRLNSGGVPPSDFSDLAGDLVSLFPILAEIKELVRTPDNSRKLSPETRTVQFQDRTYIFELLACALIRIAAGKPLVLLFEDLHAADVSVEALDYIARRLGPTPTLIVTSFRSTEVDKRHPIQKLLSGFRGDRRFGYIKLGPLSESGHHRLLENLIGGSSLDPDLVSKVYEATEGNAYFTTELVRSLMDSHSILRDDTGVWQLTGSTAYSVEHLPITIQQTVQERIEHLSEDLRETLSLCSVLGRVFDFSDLEVLAGSSSRLDSAVEALIRTGFLEEDRQTRSDRLSFSSGIVRDVVYASVPRRRKRTLHRKHAEELENRNRGRLERVYPRLFEHFVRADVPGKVIEYGFLLAQKSLDAFSPEETLRVARTLLDFLEEDAGSLHKAEARAMMARAGRMAGHLPAALKDLEEAIRIFSAEKVVEPLLECLVMAAEIAWQSLKVEDTKRWVQRGLQVAYEMDHRAARAHLLSLGATVANLQGEHAVAQEYFEELQRLRPAEALTGPPEGRPLRAGTPPHVEVAKSGSPASAMQARGGRGVLTVPIPGVLDDLDPALTVREAQAVVLPAVFETLTAAAEGARIVPWLAFSIQAEEESSCYRFRLRQNVRFHDGRKLTARDVRYSFERLLRDERSVSRWLLSPIRGAERVLQGQASELEGFHMTSCDEFVIELDQRIAFFPALLAYTPAAIIPEGTTTLSGNWREGCVGTGPFRVAGFEPGKQLRMEANPDYWRPGLPMCDGLQFQLGLSSAEIVAGFRDGTFSITAHLSPQDVEAMLRDPRMALNHREIPSLSTHLLALNLHRKPFEDESLRRDFIHAIHPEPIIRRSLGRVGVPAHTLIPPSLSSQEPLRPASRTPSGSVSKRSPLSIQIATLSLFDQRYPAFTADLFQSLEQKGFRIDVVDRQWEFRGGELDFDALLLRWVADYPDPDTFLYSLLHTEKGMLGRFCGLPELDRMIEAARVHSNPMTRHSLYRQIEEMLSRRAILLPLFHGQNYWFARPEIEGLDVNYLGFMVPFEKLSLRKQ